MAQPYLHEHVTCVAAPATWLSGPSGQLRGGADGLYVDDRRVLSRLVVTVDGAEPVPVQVRRTGAASARFTAVLPGLGDDGPDPTVTLVRGRQVGPRGGTETLTLTNLSHVPLAVEVAAACETDFATMGAVKDGTGTGSTVELRGATAAADDGMRIAVTADPLPDTASALRWRVTVAPRESWSVRLGFTRADVAPITRVAEPGRLRVTADDRRLDALVRTGVEDLDALRRADGEDDYYAAGSPWYLTLFGRDSLWAARLALPLGTHVAAGTLRALARRQGTPVDPAPSEEPGKILHEVRPADAARPAAAGLLRHRRRHRRCGSALLPTPGAGGCRRSRSSRCCRTVERRCAGRGSPATTASSRTTTSGARPGQPGLEGLRRRCPVRRRPPRRPADRAVRGAGVRLRGRRWTARALLDAFGRPGADAMARLGRRARGAVPARVLVPRRLSRRSRSTATAGRSTASPPTSATCSAPASSRAGERRGSPAHLAGHGLRFGLRTIAPALGRVQLRCPTTVGSVWPHDTAIALLGLAATGTGRRPRGGWSGRCWRRPRGFDFRLPELYGGDDDGRSPGYPASCRPQAWAAAAGPALLTALLGLDADVPAGRLTLAPLSPSPVGAYRVQGLRIAGGELDVSVSATGHPTIHSSPAGVGIFQA